MCELFGVDSAKKIPLNELLREFFRMEQNIPTVGVWHFYGNAVSLEKQPQSAVTSNYLKQRLRAKIETDKMIAHIRLATREQWTMKIHIRLLCVIIMTAPGR